MADAKQTMSVRIDAKLIRNLKEFCRKRGLVQAAFVEAALKAALNGGTK